MTTYAFWNNKGGVGKTFLAFATSCEYARLNPNKRVLVMDLCPQANLTEILLGGKEKSSAIVDSLYKEVPRKSVGGYFESRLTSPFVATEDATKFIIKPSDHNTAIPNNMYLLPGDSLLELLSEAIRQASQMQIPEDSWKRVMYWLRDLSVQFTKKEESEITVFIDCNPSFSIYNQISLCTSDSMIIPYTADDSSRRGIENILALVYGVTSSELQAYARISFSKKATTEGITLPKINSIVSNMVTMYRGEQSSAWKAKSEQITSFINIVHDEKPEIFNKSNDKLFFEMPDYHAAAIVSSSLGYPIYEMKAGHHSVGEETIQLNRKPLENYKNHLAKLAGSM